VLLKDLKRRFNQQAWKKILYIKPCIGQISGTWELLMEEKVWLLVKNKYFQKLIGH
jgi:hypothetical protein